MTAPIDAEPIPPLASRRHTARFLFIVGGIVLAGLLQTHGEAPLRNPSRIPLYMSVAACQLLFVWFVGLGIRPQGHSLGYLVGQRWHQARDAVRDFALSLALIVGLRAITAVLRYFFGSGSAKVLFLLPRSSLEISFWIALSIVAGVSEELVYRGYLQPQLRALIGQPVLAIFLQAFVFGAAHIYQGWAAAVVTVLYGLAFGIVAAWRRTLVPGMIAHGLIDIMGGLRLG